MVAGNETTRNAISHALLLLTEHPDQRELLLADLDGRIGPAVEEIVRYVSPVIWMRRTLTRDTVLNGHAFRGGRQGRCCCTRPPTGTRRVRPDRGRVRHHPVAQPARRLRRRPGRTSAWARTWPAGRSRVVLRELLTRVPDIRAAGEPDYLLSSFINGIKHLPCEFG